MSQNLSERLSKELAAGKEPTPPKQEAKPPAKPAQPPAVPPDTAQKKPMGILPYLNHVSPMLEDLVPDEALTNPRDPESRVKFVKLLLDQLAFRMNANSAIAGCELTSIKNVIKNCALLGLMPGYGGNTAEVYLIPYKRQLDYEISYKGFETVVMRSGHYKKISATALFDGDEFQHWDEDGNKRFIFKPCGVQQTLTGAFAYAQEPDGTLHLVHMDSTSIENLEEKTRKGKERTPAWRNWPDRMYRKTVIKRLCNELPNRSAIPMLDKLHAIDVDAEPLTVKQLTEGMD